MKSLSYVGLLVTVLLAVLVLPATASSAGAKIDFSSLDTNHPVNVSGTLYLPENAPAPLAREGGGRWQPGQARFMLQGFSSLVGAMTSRLSSLPGTSEMTLKMSHWSLFPVFLIETTYIGWINW